MCGIAALFRLDPDSALPPIRPMTDLIRHRGPDDEGVAVFDDDGVRFYAGPDTPPRAIGGTDLSYAPAAPAPANIELNAQALMGHRRLSIVDLSSAGHQPMSTPDSRYTIVYNGEIYNHRDLRIEMEMGGDSFVSESDTEVVLHAYRRWGMDCLNRFNGMFAFVIYDHEAKEIFAARDRFGIKPLYYWKSPKGFVAFASEIKQFTVLPGWQATLAPQRAVDFLSWGIADHTSETLFKDVYQLRGGEYLETPVALLKSVIAISSWYKPHANDFDGDLFTAADRLRELMIDSVRLRLQADVPVGTSLSGGLDSTSIVCIANELLPENERSNQKTFTACTDDPALDERRYADIVVKSRQVDAYFTYPNLDGLLENLDALTWHHDEPYLNTTVFAEWEVFKLAAANGVKVTLDGHGADELMAGYDVFFAPHYAELFARREWKRLLREIRAVKELHGLGTAFAIRGIVRMLLPYRLRQVARRRFGREPSVENWLSTQHLEATALDPTVAAGSWTSSVNSFSLSQLSRTSLPIQLTWADRDSMAHSVECRVPFLDHRVVEFLLGVPAQFKIDEGVRKRVLRRAMINHVPGEIRDRHDKMGFVTPEAAWIRDEKPDWFRQALMDAVDQSRGVLLPSVCGEMEPIINGSRPFTHVLWRVISFARWMDKFNVHVS